MTITFYDIPSQVPGKAWSPSTFRTRIALNYKGLDYKTEWIEYPDIEDFVKKIGGKPTLKWRDGRDYYTLPAIQDSKTGKVLADSIAIAHYLDDTYPDTPTLFPPGTLAAIELLNSVFIDAFEPIFPLMRQETGTKVTAASESYFRSTREAQFQKKMDEFAPPGPEREEAWASFKANLQGLSNAYAANGPDKHFFFGETFTYADVVIVSFMLWIKIIWGAESDEWKEVASWYEGRWGKLLDITAKWQKVD